MKDEEVKLVIKEIASKYGFLNDFIDLSENSYVVFGGYLCDFLTDLTNMSNIENHLNFINDLYKTNNIEIRKILCLELFSEIYTNRDQIGYIVTFFSEDLQNEYTLAILQLSKIYE